MIQPLGSRDDRWLSINDSLIREIMRDVMERLNQIDVNGDGLVIPNGFIKEAMLGSGVVTSGKYGTNSIPDTAYKDYSVGTSKLADGVLAATAAGLLKMADGYLTASKLASSLAAWIHGTVGVTVSPEVSDIITVTFQLTDVLAANLGSTHAVRVWVSDSPAGALAAVPPSGGLTAGAYGTIVHELASGTHVIMTTDATGKASLNITEIGIASWYVNVEVNGKVYHHQVTFA